MVTCGPASRVPTGLEGETATELAVGAAVVPSVGQWQQTGNMCRDCGGMFVGKRHLIEHIRAQHANKRVACPHCQCTFVSKSVRNEHVRYIHEKRMRYNCETCGKGYANRTNYFDHLASHTGAKRNVCPVCQKQFAFKHGLKSHVLHFHTSESGNR